MVRLQEALTLFREMGRQESSIFAIEGVARVGSATGHPERAAYLWGAAERLRETLGLPLPAAERDRHQRYVAAARAQLGEKRFTMLWAEGRALTLEQAVARALSQGYLR